MVRKNLASRLAEMIEELQVQQGVITEIVGPSQKIITLPTVVNLIESLDLPSSFKRSFYSRPQLASSFCEQLLLLQALHEHQEMFSVTPEQVMQQIKELFISAVPQNSLYAHGRSLVAYQVIPKKENWEFKLR